MVVPRSLARRASSSPGSSAALFVLRLVLDRSLPLPPSLPSHRFSTAALASPPDFSSPSSPFRLLSSSSSSSSTPVIDFLEPRTDADEYDEASSLLPHRSHPLRPIPWPTLFPHSDTQSPTSSSDPRTTRPRACDLLARLVAEDRISAARKVYKELEALHTPVLRRKIYLSAALSELDAATTPSPPSSTLSTLPSDIETVHIARWASLDADNEKGAFLFWLNLYPNRPATSTYPALKQTWLPVVRRIVSRYTHDLPFLASFLLLGARKGLLPVLLPPLVPHLTLVAPPSLSRQILVSAMDEYRRSTTSEVSGSENAVKQRKIVDAQINSWWNAYIRGLVVAGWDADAYLPPQTTPLETITISLLDDEVINPPQSSTEIDMSLLAAPAIHSLLPRLETAIRGSVSPAEINDLQKALASHPAELAAFETLFCYPPGTHRGRSAPTENVAKWWHAKVLGLRDAGLFDEAVQAFSDRFLWIGLPLPPNAKPKVVQWDRLMIHPSIHEITSVLPAVLHTMRPSAIPEFHEQYLRLVTSPSFAPSLRPTAATHATFVRVAGQHLGPTEAARSVERIVSAGLDPGAAGWTALMVCLLRTGETDAAMNLLEGMESRAVAHPGNGTVGEGEVGGLLRMPLPDERTYARLVRVLVQQGRRDEAKVLAKRMQARADQMEDAKTVETASEDDDDGQGQQRAHA